MPSVSRMRVGRVMTAAQKAEEAEEALPSTLRVQRRKSRIERASDAGVWTASLYLAFVAFFMPAWFLAVGLAFSHDGTAATRPSADPVQIGLLGLGTVATWFGLRASVTLSNAPRLGRGPHRSAMRRIPVVAGALSVLFLHRFVYNSAALPSDFLAYLGAMAPAVMMSEVSWALPSISKRRYGTAIGSPGGYAWALAGASVIAAGMSPVSWWVPSACAGVGSACTGLAALRIWRHYEGEIVTA